MSNSSPLARWMVDTITSVAGTAREGQLIRGRGRGRAPACERSSRSEERYSFSTSLSNRQANGAGIGAVSASRSKVVLGHYRGRTPARRSRRSTPATGARRAGRAWSPRFPPASKRARRRSSACPLVRQRNAVEPVQPPDRAGELRHVTRHQGTGDESSALPSPGAHRMLAGRATAQRRPRVSRSGAVLVAQSRHLSNRRRIARAASRKRADVRSSRLRSTGSRRRPGGDHPAA